jgi:hypothetical protein
MQERCTCTKSINVYTIKKVSARSRKCLHDQKTLVCVRHSEHCMHTSPVSRNMWKVTHTHLLRRTRSISSYRNEAERMHNTYDLRKIHLLILTEYTCSYVYHHTAMRPREYITCIIYVTYMFLHSRNIHILTFTEYTYSYVDVEACYCMSVVQRAHSYIHIRNIHILA